jgi:hypothetical protein
MPHRDVQSLWGAGLGPRQPRHHDGDGDGGDQDGQAVDDSPLDHQLPQDHKHQARAPELHRFRDLGADFLFDLNGHIITLLSILIYLTTFFP